MSTGDKVTDPAEIEALLAAGNVTTVQQDKQVYSTQVIKRIHFESLKHLF